MEFTFPPPLVDTVPGVWVLDRTKLARLSKDERERVQVMVDTFGRRSASAQGLPRPVTDMMRIRSTDQRLYLMVEKLTPKGFSVLGGLKIGRKRLFFRQLSGGYDEIDPVCVLDFYVHEKCQRTGLGLKLFKHFLALEDLPAASCAYDRPSAKLMGFLKKHFGLTDNVPQVNNFVIFNEYFANGPQSDTLANRRRRVVSSSRATPPRSQTPQASMLSANSCSLGLNSTNCSSSVSRALSWTALGTPTTQSLGSGMKSMSSTAYSTAKPPTVRVQRTPPETVSKPPARPKTPPTSAPPFACTTPEQPTPKPRKPQTPPVTHWRIDAPIPSPATPPATSHSAGPQTTVPSEQLANKRRNRESSWWSAQSGVGVGGRGRQSDFRSASVGGGAQRGVATKVNANSGDRTKGCVPPWGVEPHAMQQKQGRKSTLDLKGSRTHAHSKTGQKRTPTEGTDQRPLSKSHTFGCSDGVGSCLVWV